MSLSLRRSRRNSACADPLLQLVEPARDEPGPSDELTPRQREVLQLLAEGRSMKEVGTVLSLTARTVAFHKYRIMEQLKVKTTAELIRYAVKHHIV